MNLFGLSITRQKAATVSPISSATGGWSSIIREPFSGAWQRNISIDKNTVLSFSTVFTCVTTIASDVAKMRIKLVEQDKDGVWTEFRSPAFSPVLAKPNHYQNSIRFIESWMLSRLVHGNAYILKERDNRGIVVAMYPLDPTRTRPLVATNGDVFYDLKPDYLSGLENSSVIVPASEIIHDRWNTLFHPLCGLSPIYANGLAATQGLNIQNHSVRFFGNNARPGGVLTAPGLINKETAERIKTEWNNKFGGENTGSIAVLGDGLKFESMAMTAEASQLIEQMKFSAETVCATFNFPLFMAGLVPTPPYGNTDGVWQLYYKQCLQKHLESIELCLDDGLGLTEVPGKTYGTEFDTDVLLRMDMGARIDAAVKAIGGGVIATNEARSKWFDFKPVPDGDDVRAQQQMYSLEALSERDEDKPFSKPVAATPAAPATPANPDDPNTGKEMDGIKLLGPMLLDYELRRLPPVITKNAA